MDEYGMHITSQHDHKSVELKPKPASDRDDDVDLNDLNEDDVMDLLNWVLVFH